MKKAGYILISLLWLLPSISCKKTDTVIPREGLINFTIGDVSIVSQGAEQAAKVGDVIKEGMSVITKGDKSQAEIFFGDNAIKVLGNTTLDVQKLIANITQSSERTELFVKSGAVFSKVKKLSKNDDYMVKSPTSTAGVRGTEFIVEDRGEKANISCISGEVECANNTIPDSDPIIIRENEEVVIEPGKDMVKQQIADDRLRMLNIIRNINEIREDIRDKYMKQKEDMRKQFEEAREKFREDVTKQRDEDRARVDAQKAGDKARVDEVKGTTQQAAKDVVSESQSQMSAAKEGANKESATGGLQNQINQMKQLNKNQVSPQQ